MEKRLHLLFFFTLFSIQGYTQSPEVLKVRTYCTAHQSEMFSEYISFLSIPNIAADTPNLQKSAAFIMDMMKKRGIQKIQLLTPKTTGAASSVYGEVIVPGAKQTLIFYAHYDGQPVNPAQWAQGLHPFEPKLLNGSLEKNASIIPFPGDGRYDPEWRIYARGASDDKAGVMAILNAYDAIVKSGVQLTSNIKFFFEGEEEAGSDHLHEIFEKYKDLLQSDLWIICDGPVHQSGKKQVVFGVRGDVHLELTVFASKRPLHSGHYGNWAPNPAMVLAKLLASMKDEDGKVTVRGFYDDVTPLSAAEKKAINEIPSVDEQMKKELGFSKPEMKNVTLAEAITLPSLNINGIQSANVGKLASNVIPTTATATIDLRLVPGNEWQKQQLKVIAHIREQGFYVTEKEPTDQERSKYEKIVMVKKSNGYNAQRTPMDLPIAKNVVDAVRSSTSEEVVLVPTLGGSLPLYLFEVYLGAKTITVPIANHDNNQHAENENIRLRNLWIGIETMAALMMMKK